MTPYLLIFLGGGIGSVCRFAIWQLCIPWESKFPIGTLLANLLACILIGILVGIGKHHGLHDYLRFLFITGFCGGFSTFSTFTAENMDLWQNGQWMALAMNILLSLALCFIGLYLGMKMIR